MINYIVFYFTLVGALRLHLWLQHEADWCSSSPMSTKPPTAEFISSATLSYLLVTLFVYAFIVKLRDGVNKYHRCIIQSAMSKTRTFGIISLLIGISLFVLYATQGSYIAEDGTLVENFRALALGWAFTIVGLLAVVSSFFVSFFSK